MDVPNEMAEENIVSDEDVDVPK